MFDIARTLSCCRGAKASILADRETWRINSSGGGYLIHYQVNTFPSCGYPQTQDNTSPGLLWLTRTISFWESPLVFDWFLLRPPPEGNSHTHFWTKTHAQTDKDLVEKMWKLPSGSRFVCHRVTYWTRGLTNQLAGPRFLGKKKKKPSRKEAKWQRRC